MGSSCGTCTNCTDQQLKHNEIVSPQQHSGQLVNIEERIHTQESIQQQSESTPRNVILSQVDNRTLISKFYIDNKLGTSQGIKNGKLSIIDKIFFNYYMIERTIRHLNQQVPVISEYFDCFKQELAQSLIYQVNFGEDGPDMQEQFIQDIQSLQNTSETLINQICNCDVLVSVHRNQNAAPTQLAIRIRTIIKSLCSQTIMESQKTESQLIELLWTVNFLENSYDGLDFTIIQSFLRTSAKSAFAIRSMLQQKLKIWK